jgi:hypothetical protein
MENFARYIIRASFSQERMTYHRETGHVEYKSKGGSQMKVFDVLEWLAAMCSHVPNKGEQMARYYVYFLRPQSVVLVHERLYVALNISG